MEEHERVKADKGYRASDPELCKTPGGLSSLFDNEEKKEIRNRVMARQEVLNKHIKNFAILRHRFRHKLECHGKVFRAVLVILQIGFEFGGEELYACENY